MSKRTLFLIIPIVVVLVLFAGSSSIFAQGPAGGSPQAALTAAFTYQGRLRDGSSNPINSTCDFTVSAWAALNGGTQVGSDCSVTGVQVVDGYFTVQLNAGGEFSGTAFRGDARWLEISVQCSGDPAPTLLSPRQELTATPYALSLMPGAVVEGAGGITGWDPSASGQVFGIYGRADSPDGTGVSGWATSATGVTYGVYGAANFHRGSGVYGWAGAATGENYAIFGKTESVDGWAGYFLATRGNGVYISAAAGKVGLNVAGGTKNAVVATADGARLLYTEESAEVWFTDYGTGQLTGGTGTVTIDPICAQTVNLDKSYLVFLTPQGDCGLYVAAKTPTSFTVRALDGQTCSIAFDYRIVAKRLGYEDTRLERAPWADNDPNLYPEKRPASPSPFAP
jgi:hypothetical protein